jgi:hypothetical protein
MKKKSCCGHCFNIALGITRKDDKAFEKFLRKYFQPPAISNSAGHRPHSGASSCESSPTLRDRRRRQSVAANRPASSTQVHPVSTKSSGDGKKYFAAQAFAMHPYFTSHCIPSACIQPHGSLTIPTPPPPPPSSPLTRFRPPPRPPPSPPHPLISPPPPPLSPSPTHYTRLYKHLHLNIAIIAIMSCIMSGTDFPGNVFSRHKGLL